MDTFEFVITIVLLTASGALAPGALFFINISYGSQYGAKSGFIFSISHTVIEFSLIMVFALGLLTIASEPIVKLIIGTVGGIFLIIFGILQFKNSIQIKTNYSKPRKSSFSHLFLIGLAFTGLNPFFIIWWLTVGGELILISLAFAGLLGVILMFISHVWMDYVWLTTIAYFAKKGTQIIGSRGYRFLIGVFAVILVYFGITFIMNALEPYI
jgi:threonine/homoserine/homoserine lactone efflux protein